MHFNLKKIVLALVAAPAVFGYIDQPCISGEHGEGVCVKTSACTMKAGQVGTARYYKGFCKNDPADVLCCVKEVTTLASGKALPRAGRCKNVSQCPKSSNTIYSNQCPGSANVKLCVPSTSQSEPQPQQPSTSQYEIIDLSKYNVVNDYNAAAGSINGVILRTGFRSRSSGSLNKDVKFEDHYNGFLGKTKIGYYFFTQAITAAEAEEEATYVVNTILKGKVVDFPIYWDSEGSGAANNSGRADSLSKAQRTACAVAFVNKIKDLGYRAGVYASQSWFSNNLDFSQIVNAGASIWVAKYSESKPTTSQYDAWQYTSSGSIPGIEGNVDRSHVYTNIAGW